MNPQNISLVLWTLLLLLRSVLAIEEQYPYNEIEKQCGSFLSYAFEFEPDDSRPIRLKKDLSVSGGDWAQDHGSSPLMPFDDTDSWAWFPPEPVKFVNFDVKDVSPIQHVRNAVRLNGYLTVGIHRNRSLDSDIGFELGFIKKPGFSTLIIAFEGAYVENGGEKVLCLLGNLKMPFPDRIKEEEFSSDLSIYGSRSELHPDDDRVLLVLRYPRSFNLTSRAIKGEMRSFHEWGSSRYFDPVRITSQLMNFSEYSFSETIPSRVCNDSLFRDEVIENGAIGFNSSKFCKIFGEMPSIRFGVEPNVDPEKSRLGPFVLNNEKIDPNRHREDFKMIFQSIKCEAGNGSIGTAKVSAIVRAISEKIDKETASFRTGISGTTMSIEGSWNNDEFCGVGCVEDRCDSQISFYFPRSFSVKQRNIVSGTISSIENQTEALKFRFLARSGWLMDYTAPCRYHYSKIEAARELWERSQCFDVARTIKNSILRYPSVLRYPKIEDGFYRLSKQLSFRSYVLLSRPHYAGRFLAEVDILSLGPLCSDVSGSDVSDPRLLNVSIRMTFIEEPHWFFYANYEVVTDMFFEGLYDTSLGEMHLTGCSGNVRMDCSIEARLEYPPLNTRWLKRPIVNINVTSQRNATDPLRFNPIRLKSFVMGSDGRDEKDLLFRVIFEGMIRVLVLAVDIGIVLSQFGYMNENVDIVPRISLVTLGIQILGYVVPIIIGSEIVLDSKMSKSFKNGPDLIWADVIKHSTRFLLLVAVLLMSRLFYRVAASRTQESAEKSEHVVPNEKNVLRITSAIHVIGFVLFAAPKMLLRDTSKPPPWATVLKKYFYVVQISWPIPQVIANYLWKNPVPPVRRIYTVWFVFSRIFLDYYDRFRDHIPYPTSWEMKDMLERVDEMEMDVPYEGETVLTVALIVAVVIVFICRRRNIL